MAVMGYTRGDILRYIFLPQILPRIRELTSAGFSHLAFFIAQVFRAGNILPANHPYLQTGAIGTYGIVDALSLAAKHVSFDGKNIDKVIFFFSVIAGLVMLAIQFFLLLLSMFISPAAAEGRLPENYSSFLVTRQPNEDLAFRLMDRVFGIPGLFGSQDAPQGDGSAFHNALHGLFQFYSLGLLVIAGIIIAYFVAAIIAETAETGTPFGKRYNHVWAPVRLVLALGLLIPMGQGLNAAQWITLYAAKFGSGFATNGWLLFNATLGEQYKSLTEDDNADKLVHTPERPDLRRVVAFMNMAKTCQQATTEAHKLTINAYLVKNPSEGAGAPLGDYEAAREFFNKTGNIYIRFGELNSARYTDQKGHVFPYCGEIMLPTSETHHPGAKILNRHYFDLIVKLWNNDVEGMHKYARNDAACAFTRQPFRDECQENLRPADFSKKIMDAVNKDLDKGIQESVKAQRDEFLKGIYGEPGKNNGTVDELKKFGWGGAGIYYNTVATLNGAIATSLQNGPFPILQPSTIQKAGDEARQQNKDGAGTLDEGLATRGGVKFDVLGDEQIFNGIKRTEAYWNNILSAGSTQNIIIDAIDLILGTNAIFNMCKNADVHPLAQLAGIGRSLMESATRNLGIALFATVGGMALSASSMTAAIGAIASAASSFYITFAMIGLMLGFLMYYVIPFMPFLYFFFAVTGWVKGIFEAMVGVPLWALAHLRIDGQGLPGDAAAQGYFLILEIFLRPILIIFGLLAAISIFAAMVRVLNDIFVLVVSNVGGFNRENIELCNAQATSSAAVGSADYYRGPVDQFFFTVVYAIVVYLIGTSTFKMIDAVPNKVLRWMGASVNSFGDTQKDAGEGLLNKLSIGGYAMTNQLQGAFSSVGNFFNNGKEGLIPAVKKGVDAATSAPTDKSGPQQPQ